MQSSQLDISNRDSLPSAFLHRSGDTFNNRVNERVNDVRTETRDGVLWAVKAEPKDGKVPIGVSFHDIQQPYLKHQHYQIKHGQCYTTQPSGLLPVGIAMLQDSPLEFPPLRKDGQLATQGRHYSLYPTEHMLFTDFEAKVRQTRHLVCAFKAAAEQVDFPDPRWPTDVRMCNIVIALNLLSETCDDPDTALLAWAYSHHISSTDMAYDELLADTGVLPSLAATAMEQQPEPETGREIDMCNDMKTDLGTFVGYVPVLYGDEI